MITSYKIDGETFKQVKDFPNYFVSDRGRVYNQETKRYIGSSDRYGNVRVGLYNNDKTLNIAIHELVMKYYGKPKPYPWFKIHHINGQNDDNDIFNLEWIDKKRYIFKKFFQEN